jgi:tetratricopeptide (TPR) repeat protein
MTNQAQNPNDEVRHSGFVIDSSFWFRIWSLIVFVFAATPHVSADSVFVGTLERPDATIQSLDGDSLTFQINDRVSQIPISKISRIVVDSDPPLTAAEEAYSVSNWDEAVDDYQKAIRTTAKEWVKQWSAMRLIDAANKTGRFDAAASAYLITLLHDPATAAKIKPVMPDSKSAFLDSAVSDVNDSLKDQTLSVDQRRALLGFLIENAAYEQIAHLPGADANDPDIRRHLANQHLANAAADVQAKKFQQAIEEIDSNRSLFGEAAEQAEALYILAQAHYGLAGSDPNALKDAALAYMRVVALAKDQPAAPHVAESLLKTAEIMQRLGEPATAAKIDQQVLSQFPNDPAAPQARENLNRLKNQPTQH